MNLGKFFCRGDADNYREVLKMLPDAVFVVELTGEISWVNLKAMTLFETFRKPLMGSFFDEIVADGLVLAREAAQTGKSVASGAFSRGEGEIFVELSAVENDDQYYIAVRDTTSFTNLLSLAEDAGRLNKEKNYMLCKLSGDLKSPLQSITGFSQALLDGLGGELNEKQNKYVRIINKNAAEMGFFLDKLLEFSRVESSLFKIEPQTFDIVNLVQNMLKILAVQEPKLDLSFDFETLVKKTVYSDENALRLILQNLIDTMIKMSQTGKIGITLSNPEKSLPETFLQITISGVGIGIPEAEKADLFNPYMLLEKANKKGLLRSISLATVEAALKKMSGSVWIDYNQMYGIEFNVILPIDKPATEV
jgi:signal transduction histidine kinase